MTKVVFYRQGGRIVKVKSIGHTGYADAGQDIVCSALSTVIQTGVLGIQQVIMVDGKYEVNAKKAELSFELPEDLDEAIWHDTQVIMNTMLLAVKDLANGYPDFIKMEVK